MVAIGIKKHRDRQTTVSRFPVSIIHALIISIRNVNHNNYVVAPKLFYNFCIFLKKVVQQVTSSAASGAKLKKNSLIVSLGNHQGI